MRPARIESSPDAGKPAACVLVVDDDEQIVDLITLLLEEAGYATLRASSGEECVHLAVAKRPAVILLDVRLPGMDGNATARALSLDEGSRGIPVVMMTGFMEDEDRINALEAGAIDFLVKPLAPGELIAKVRSLVKLKAYHDVAENERRELLAEVAGKEGQLEEALAAFARFVPREFLTCLKKKSIVEVSLGDQVQAEMSILFADIRSFTAMSEKMSPRENFEFLNAYLGRMNPYIWENGGYIDKYIGDAIMALFPTGPGAALDAAIAMLRHIPVYNLHRKKSGHGPIAIGIGINSGPVMLGIIGHERFMQGTVISDAVNLSSRLEELTKYYGVSLVVSKFVLFGLENPNRYGYRFLDNVQVKGKEDLIPVYEVFDADPPELIAQKLATREAFERATYEFHAGRYGTALELFEALPRSKATDKPVEIYHDRCFRALSEAKGPA